MLRGEIPRDGESCQVETAAPTLTVPAVEYHLAVLTHGPPKTLNRTLESFNEMVTPTPSSIFVRRDPGEGFCRATKAMWDHLQEVAERWVFWLEHDFLFKRPVDLAELAQTITANPSVVQMALCRQPVNATERAAGGLVQSIAESLTRHQGWLEHRRYWTTNPSLFKTAIAKVFPWPAGPECEGKFGIELLKRRYDTSFGIWGDGEIWVDHVGRRNGHGY